MLEHARSISKQLKSLRRETELAKRLILNEKRLDALFSLLERSKETIVHKSLETIRGVPTPQRVSASGQATQRRSHSNFGPSPPVIATHRDELVMSNSLSRVVRQFSKEDLR